MAVTEFWGSFLAGLLSGIIVNLTFGVILAFFTGILASVFFFLSLLWIKPNVKISDKLSLERQADGSLIYRVKVVNRTRKMITNLKYSMIYTREISKDLYENEELVNHKPILPALSRHTKNGADYAVRLSYIVKPEDKIDINDPSSVFIFTFVADHSISNTTTCIEKRYKAADIVEGTFETCDSMTITAKGVVRP